MNHIWDENNECIRCGILREKRTQKLLMAITNHPPYNHYKYETRNFYIEEGKDIGFKRPDCKPRVTYDD